MEKVTDTETVYKFITKNPGKTKKELALLMGLKIETFKYHYKKLLSGKRIEKIDDLTKITTEKVELLEKYFRYGLTDEQACYKADVVISTFYNYCRENPDFADRRNTLKDDTIINAKILVAEKVEEKDESFTKLVYQHEKMKERATVRLDLGVEKEEEEDISAKNISLKVTIDMD